MKNPDLANDWFKAGIALGKDATAKVLCPVCKLENLEVTDVTIDGTKKFERILSCPNCHSSNVLLMKKGDA